MHGVAIAPGDGTLLLATHEGLMEVGEGGEITAPGPVVDLRGHPVTGPDPYLASGHPGPHIDPPQPVGLLESTDGGETRTPLSRAGSAAQWVDLHQIPPARRWQPATAVRRAGRSGSRGAVR